MRPPSRRLDPQGYYARLGVDPAATQEAITHAFRRKALVLHPDVPKTGDSEAFVAIRAAYDVLSHPDRRRAYDQAAAAPEQAPPQPAYTVPHGAHDFRPHVADAPWMDDDRFFAGPGFTPRPSTAPPVRDRGVAGPVIAAAGFAAILCAGVVGAVMAFRAAPVGTSAGVPPTAPPVAPQTAGAQQAALYGPAPVRLAGTPNFYVVPSAGPTMIWRQEKDRNQIAPIGQLPPFSSVQALRVNRQTGLVEVRYDATTTAYIEARHLAPGDALAARRAYCSYNAGPVPYDGEVLERRGQGAGALRIENHAMQPAVVKFRAPNGSVALAVFLGPNGEIDLGGVPAGRLGVEYAIGELWSRACNSFAAGMRARRITAGLTLGGDATLILPSDEDAAVDIQDQAFEVE